MKYYKINDRLEILFREDDVIQIRQDKKDMVALKLKTFELINKEIRKKLFQEEITELIK